ncbi:helix-turn-helix transcriptional regulator [Octadecabacter sp. 1_MG-2023]|uniref:helix-turn-helix domain-containing protein n=1 Tax=unclassified Octadecabacter TaxID=196158 RepID=UPI001C087FD1|nr:MULTISPECIES: helix-turn-helix transcriptional regulator [unclassified Octadecabacter]MBU2991665.1 helix-turn-helix transcriptional regulator [Octadecabacter sp. B2R22]MDO6736191.1 helix-turn-helix transcriptional regulator [Octadecabacter sp. 1_MG-2023]
MMEIRAGLYWEHLGVAGALAVSVFVLLGLMLRLRDTSPHRMHIWAMIAFFTITVSDGLNSFAYSDTFNGPPTLYRWNDVIIPGFMVALYFYVRALTSAAPKLVRADLVHLVPFLTGFLCLAPALILPGEVRLGLVPSDITDGHQTLIDTGETAFWILWVIVLIVYGAICIRRLSLHKRNIRNVFSDLEGKTLRWLDGLVATILIIALIVIADEIGQLLGQRPIRDGIRSLFFDVIMPVSFGIFALRANPPLPEWTEAVLEDASVPNEPAQQDNPSSRYARSGLTEADMNRYAARLEKRMADGQLWRDHGLNLRGLAAEIAIPPIHLSEVLNTKIGMSFYDYVNQCRIRDACDLLINSNDTIIEISEAVGFNAKSTFNTSFKKVTGQTPSQWRTTHKP